MGNFVGLSLKDWYEIVDILHYYGGFSLFEIYNLTTVELEYYFARLVKRKREEKKAMEGKMKNK